MNEKNRNTDEGLNIISKLNSISNEIEDFKTSSISNIEKRMILNGIKRNLELLETIVETEKRNIKDSKQTANSLERVKENGIDLLAILNSIAAEIELWNEDVKKATIDRELVQLKIEMLQATGYILKNI